MDVDGYVVWAVGFTGTQVQVERLLALIDELYAATGQPIVVAGVSYFWQLALSRGAASAVHGRRTKLNWPPDALEPKPRPVAEDEEDDGFGVAVYHGSILGSIQIGERADVERRRLFFRHPCDCGHHPRGTAPEGQETILAHNLWWSMDEARQVCLQSLDRAVLVLGLRAVVAVKFREGLGLTRLATGWRALADAQERGEHRSEEDA
jgi:hypothetical protein